MAAVLLDTTVLIDLLRGRPGTTERMMELRKHGDTPYTCAINVEEVVRGLRLREQDAAAVLLDALAILPLGRVEGQTAGHWRRDYAKRGTSLAQADCLIAAAASCANARLATGNVKDFPMIDAGALEHWPVDK